MSERKRINPDGTFLKSNKKRIETYLKIAFLIIAFTSFIYISYLIVHFIPIIYNDFLSWYNYSSKNRSFTLGFLSAIGALLIAKFFKFAIDEIMYFSDW